MTSRTDNYARAEGSEIYQSQLAYVTAAEEERKRIEFYDKTTPHIYEAIMPRLL